MKAETGKRKPERAESPARLLALVLIVFSCGAARAAESAPSSFPYPVSTFRSRIIAAADAMVGWHEATGRNDGRNIDAILGAVGLAGTRNPYCAAFVVKCGDDALGRAFNPYPRSAWSPDMVPRPTWTRARGGPEPRPADTFGIYFPAKGRVAHTGLVRRNLGNVIETVEGNTSPDAVPGSAADRNGGGVCRKRRLRAQLHATQDHLRTP
jgi:hypothetical protein